MASAGGWVVLADISQWLHSCQMARALHNIENASRAVTRVIGYGVIQMKPRVRKLPKI